MKFELKHLFIAGGVVLGATVIGVVIYFAKFRDESRVTEDGEKTESLEQREKSLQCAFEAASKNIPGRDLSLSSFKSGEIYKKIGFIDTIQTINNTDAAERLAKLNKETCLYSLMKFEQEIAKEKEAVRGSRSQILEVIYNSYVFFFASRMKQLECLGLAENGAFKVLLLGNEKTSLGNDKASLIKSLKAKRGDNKSISDFFTELKELALSIVNPIERAQMGGTYLANLHSDLSLI